MQKFNEITTIININHYQIIIMNEENLKILIKILENFKKELLNLIDKSKIDNKNNEVKIFLRGEDFENFDPVINYNNNKTDFDFPENFMKNQAIYAEKDNEYEIFEEIQGITKKHQLNENKNENLKIKTNNILADFSSNHTEIINNLKEIKFNNQEVNSHIPSKKSSNYSDLRPQAKNYIITLNEDLTKEELQKKFSKCLE